MRPQRITTVFLDRDGVLNTYLPGAYVRNPEELEVIPGVAKAIRRLNDAGLHVIVISNQQGVGKGVMSTDDLQTVQNSLESELARQAGARLDRCYYCVDLKSAHSPRRKPEPGMLWEAAHDFGLNLAETVFVGDTPTDIQAGQAAAVGATLLVLSGATQAEHVPTFDPSPDYVFPDLPLAVDWILEPEGL